MTKHNWTRVSLTLHVLFGICVIIQLATLLIKWYSPENSWLHANRGSIFQYHFYSGMVFFVLALIFFLYKAFVQHQPSFGYLYPYHRRYFPAVWADVKSLCGGRLPVRSGGGLAGLIQGLGLLLILGLGASGTLSFISWRTALLPSSVGSFLMPYHHLLGNILYWYLVGHVGMSIVHRLTPSRFWVCYE